MPRGVHKEIPSVPVECEECGETFLRTRAMTRKRFCHYICQEKARLRRYRKRKTARGYYRTEKWRQYMRAYRARNGR